MATKVIDASALGALVFGEPQASAIAEQLRESELIAPSLLPFEMASICLKKARRHLAQRNTLIEALGLAGRMPIALHDVDHIEVLALAERENLSTYDASYLWLALARRSELVTLDRDLATAAARRTRPR